MERASRAKSHLRLAIELSSAGCRTLSSTNVKPPHVRVRKDEAAYCGADLAPSLYARADKILKAQSTRLQHSVTGSGTFLVSEPIKMSKHLLIALAQGCVILRTDFVFDLERGRVLPIADYQPVCNFGIAPDPKRARVFCGMAFVLRSDELLKTVIVLGGGTVVADAGEADMQVCCIDEDSRWPDIPHVGFEDIVRALTHLDTTHLPTLPAPAQPKCAAPQPTGLLFKRKTANRVSNGAAVNYKAFRKAAMADTGAIPEIMSVEMMVPHNVPNAGTAKGRESWLSEKEQTSKRAKTCAAASETEIASARIEPAYKSSFFQSLAKQGHG